MTQVVSDAKLGEFARRQNDWFRWVREGSLDPDEVNEAVQAVIMGEISIRSGLFIFPDQQLELVRMRNSERNWGFTGEDFEKLGEPPVWPLGLLAAVVLDVGLDTVQQTFEEAWACIVESQKEHNSSHWRWDQIKFDKDHLRLHGGITHERGLRWRVINLAANWDKKEGIRPKDVRNNSSPHSAVLWAASYFPHWVQAMDGTNVPYVWISGYEFNVDSNRSWMNVPGLSWDPVNREVKRSTYFVDNRYHDWAVPSLREY